MKSDQKEFNWSILFIFSIKNELTFKKNKLTKLQVSKSVIGRGIVKEFWLLNVNGVTTWRVSCQHKFKVTKISLVTLPRAVPALNVPDFVSNNILSAQWLQTLESSTMKKRKYYIDII